MKNALICYIIILNLLGFALMGLDKYKAVHHHYRISERTLFLVTFLGGSIGTFFGMYVFRHKTRHLIFVFGIPAILLVQLLLIQFVFSWNQKRLKSPSHAVEYELDLIHNLDEETIRSFVSFENLMDPVSPVCEFNQETSEAVDLFFKNFDYHIHNEVIKDQEATVTASISNLDMKALAQDVRLGILEKSAQIDPQTSTSLTTSDYYKLLSSVLMSHTYDTVVCSAVFHLKKENDNWILLADTETEDTLVGGFITYMKDPYLLSPRSVLSAYLDAFKHLDEDGWSDLLSVNDVFSTGSPDYASRIDAAYIHQIASCFDYEILRCDTNENISHISVRIRSIDLQTLFSRYKETLLSYSSDPSSLHTDDQKVSDELSLLLLRTLEEETLSSSSDVDLILRNNGTTWVIDFNSEFVNAVMGDVNAALSLFS